MLLNMSLLNKLKEYYFYFHQKFLFLPGLMIIISCAMVILATYEKLRLFGNPFPTNKLRKNTLEAIPGEPCWIMTKRNFSCWNMVDHGGP